MDIIKLGRWGGGHSFLSSVIERVATTNSVVFEFLLCMEFHRSSFWDGTSHTVRELKHALPFVMCSLDHKLWYAHSVKSCTEQNF